MVMAPGGNLGGSSDPGAQKPADAANPAPTNLQVLSIRFPTNSVGGPTDAGALIGTAPGQANTPYTVSATNLVQSYGGIRIGNAAGSGAKIWGGFAVPSAGIGTNGDWYFRSDPAQAAGSRVYFMTGGAWVATAL